MDLKKLVILLAFMVVLPIPIRADLVLDYSDIGITHACSYYNMTDSTVNALTWINDVKTLNISQITELQGDLKNLVISWRVNQTYQNAIPNCTLIDNPYFDGNQTLHNYTSFCNPYNETKWRYTYEPVWSSTVSKSVLIVPTITSNLNAHSTSAYLLASKDGYMMLSVCGDYSFSNSSNGWGVSIDHVPTFKGTDYPNYAWWNTSFSYCRNISVTGGSSLARTYINLTNTTHMNSDYSDIRFINATCNNGGYALNYFKRNSTANWASFDLELDGNQNISIYYGNTTPVSSASNIWNVWGNNIVEYYTYDNVPNNSVNPAEGSWSGTPTYNTTSSQKGQAAGSLDSTNYITSLGTWGYTTPLTSGAVAFWVMRNGASYSYNTIVKTDPWVGGAKAEVQLRLDSATGFTANLVDNEQTQTIGNQGTFVWHFYVWEFNSTHWWLYQDNAYQGGKAITNLGIGNASQTSYWGKYGTSSSYPFNGWLDELQIYNATLSQSDINQLFNLTQATFSVNSEQNNAGGSSPTNMTLTINGASANASQSYGLADNITAIVNVTGLPVNITVNGTQIAYGTTSTNINYTFPAGYWNVTGFTVGNATFLSSSQTYWINVSKASLLIFACIQNSTNTYCINVINNGVCQQNSANTIYETYPNAFNLTIGTLVSNVTPIGTFLFQNYYSHSGVDTYISNATNNTFITYNVTAGSDQWHVWFNYSSNQNYTGNSSLFGITVKQGTPQINVTFNTSDIVIKGIPVLVNCNYPAELSATLSNDSGAISNPFTVNTNNLLGIYNYSCYSAGNANYTSYSTPNHNLTVVLSGALIINQVLDEKSLAPLTFNLTIYNASFSQTINNINTYNNNSLAGALTVLISKTGYIPRNYYINVSSNSSYNMTGYILDSGSGVYVTYWSYSNINPTGEDFSWHKFYRFIGSSYVDVAESTADTEGKGTIYLDPYTNYEILSQTSNGALINNISSYNPNPSFILRIFFGGGNAISNTSWLFTNAYYSLDPTDIYLRPSNATGNVTQFNYTIADSNSSTQWYALQLISSNGTVLYYSNQTNPSGGSILVNLNYTSLSGTIIAQTYFKRSGFDLFSWNRTYIVWRTYSAIPEVLAGLSSSGLPVVVISLIAMFVSFGIAIITNRVIRTGSGIIYLIILTIFGMYGLFGSNPTVTWQIIEGLWFMEVGIIMYREIW